MSFPVLFLTFWRLFVYGVRLLCGTNTSSNIFVSFLNIEEIFLVPSWESQTELMVCRHLFNMVQSTAPNYLNRLICSIRISWRFYYLRIIQNSWNSMSFSRSGNPLLNSNTFYTFLSLVENLTQLCRYF